MEHQGGIGWIEIDGYGFEGLTDLFRVQVQLLSRGTCILQNTGISFNDLNK